MSTDQPLRIEQTDTEIVMTRLFDAPRELLWQVWTDPSHVANWWGPKGFTTTTHRMDVRSGGEWKYVMHGPDGRDYQNHIAYLEVARPSRLRYKHGGDVDCEPVNFEVVVTFDAAGPAGKQTLLTMRLSFPSKNAKDFVVREYNAVEGGKQTIGRLAEYVAGAGSEGRDASQPVFTIDRVYHAPQGMVWDAWTRREHLAKWFGPKGVSIPHCSLDLRVGGTFHYCMRWSETNEHWGLWVFREITPPDRLVFVVSFADPKGHEIRNPWDEKWPLEMLSTVTFHPHAGSSRGTLVTVEWTPVNASPEELAAFRAGFASMEQGWGGTLEQLGEHLRTT